MLSNIAAFPPRYILYYFKVVSIHAALLFSCACGLLLALALWPWDLGVLALSIAARLYAKLGTIVTGIEIEVIDGKEWLETRNAVQGWRISLKWTLSVWCPTHVWNRCR